MLKLIEAKGSPYECGRIFGDATRENILYRMNWCTPDGMFERHQAALPQINDACEKHYPQLAQELKGIADGAGIDYWRLLLLNSPEIREEVSGCTTIAVNENDKLSLMHNEDGGGNDRAADCFLLHYSLENGCSFYAFAYAGVLPGCSYSWNSHHLYFSVNYLKPIGMNLAGRVPRNFVSRAMIEAENVEAAIAFLKNSHDASGYHYYLGQGERLCSIENHGNRVSVKEVAGVDIHANHYLHPMFAPAASSSEHSRIRLAQARKLVGDGQEPMRVLTDRAHAPNAICTRQHEALNTISTIEFLPKEKRVTLFKPETLEREQSFVL